MSRFRIFLSGAIQYDDGPSQEHNTGRGLSRRLRYHLIFRASQTRRSERDAANHLTSVSRRQTIGLSALFSLGAYALTRDPRTGTDSP